MDSSSFYVPPPGLHFRLVNKESEKVLSSNSSARPPVFQAPADEVKGDQWFSLIHGTGTRAGKYAIKGKESEKVIFNRRHNEPNIGHSDGNGNFDENWHVLEPGRGDNTGWFRIVTPIPANVALASANDTDPYLVSQPAGHGAHSSHNGSGLPFMNGGGFGGLGHGGHTHNLPWPFNPNGSLPFGLNPLGNGSLFPNGSSYLSGPNRPANGSVPPYTGGGGTGWNQSGTGGRPLNGSPLANGSTQPYDNSGPPTNTGSGTTTTTTSGSSARPYDTDRPANSGSGTSGSAQPYDTDRPAGSGSGTSSGAQPYDTSLPTGGAGSNTASDGTDSKAPYSGGAGPDATSGGAGSDATSGGAGSDAASGGAGPNGPVGGDGSNVATGGADSNTPYGGSAGPDAPSGGADANAPSSGGVGPDATTGGADPNAPSSGGVGPDAATGGADSNAPSGGATGPDAGSGGAGTGAVSGGVDSNAPYGSGADPNAASGGAGPDATTAGGAGSAGPIDGAGSNAPSGGVDSNTASGGADSNTASGGTDSNTASGSTDSNAGGADSNTAGGGGDSSVIGGAGPDAGSGGAGPDTASGETRPNAASGGAGPDGPVGGGDANATSGGADSNTANSGGDPNAATSGADSNAPNNTTDSNPTNSATDSTSANQPPSAESEEFIFSSFEWDFAAAKVVSTERKVVGDMEVENNSDKEQTYTFNLTEEAVTKGTTEQLDNLSLVEGTKFSSTLPTIKGREIVSDGQTIEWTIGSPIFTNALEMSERSFFVPARSSAHVIATAAESNIEVPFVAKVKGTRTGTVKEMKGVWRGVVSGYDVQCKEDKPSGPDSASEPTPEVREEPEDFVVSSLEWDFAATKIVSTERKPAGDVEVENNSSKEQTYTFNLAEEVVTKGVAEQVDQLSLVEGTKISSTLPTGKGKEIVSNGQTIEWTFGASTFANTLEMSERTFVIGPKSSAQAVATAAESKVEVPFVAKVKGTRTGAVKDMKGVWRGVVSGYDVQCEVKKL